MGGHFYGQSEAWTSTMAEPVCNVPEHVLKENGGGRNLTQAPFIKHCALAWGWVHTERVSCFNLSTSNFWKKDRETQWPMVENFRCVLLNFFLALTLFYQRLWPEEEKVDGENVKKKQNFQNWSMPTGRVERNGKGLSLKELLALTGTWGEHSCLTYERTNLTVEGRGPTEDIEHWEEQKP